MTIADVVLLVLFGAAFVAGFASGLLRSLLALGAWAVAFVLAANLREPVGDYLASQWTTLSPDTVRAVVFGGLALLLYLIGRVLILLGTRGSREVTPYRTLDALLGGPIEALIMVLVVASAMVVLGATDAAPATGTVSGVPYLVELRTALGTSTIGSLIAESVVPVMGTILGPLLPGVVAGSMR